MSSIPSEPGTVDDGVLSPPEPARPPARVPPGPPRTGRRGAARPAERENRRTRSLRLALFGLVGAWNLPAIGLVAEPARVPEGFRLLDPSWVIAVNWAFARGLAWGREIVFPYGPLGFLYQNTLIEVGHFRLSVLFELGVYALLIAALHRFTKAIGLGLGWTAAFAAALVLLPLPGLDFQGPILLALLMFLALPGAQAGRRGAGPWAALGIGFLAALLSLVKLTLLVSAAGLVGLFALALAAPRLGEMLGDRELDPEALREAARAAAPPVLAYAGSFAVLWVAAGQPLGALDDFLLGGVELASGYSAAMGLVHFHQFTALGFGSATLLPILGTAFLLVFSVFVAEAATRMGAVEADIPALFLLAASLGVSCVAFKHGFVRFDGHVFGFLSTVPLVALLAVAVSRTRLSPPTGAGTGPPRSDLAVAGLGILALVALFGGFPVAPLHPPVAEHADEYRQAAVLFVDGERARGFIEEQKLRLREEYGRAGAAGLREAVGDRSIDAMPWDVALLWATDLEWAPRPAFHSYATYTARLDDMNARSLRDDPPDYIVYRHLAIDGQHPMYANPSTMRVIGNGYDHVSDLGGGHMLLRRSDEPEEIRLAPLVTTTATFGERIAVPATGGRVYAKIHIRYSLRGRVWKTLYRPGRIHIRLFSTDGVASRRYRLVADPAANGLLVSGNVDRPEAFRALLAGADPGGVATIELTTEARSHYLPEITIELVRAVRPDGESPATTERSSG